MRRARHDDSGLTLIELLVSMALIAIALALIAPLYLAVSGSSSQSVAMATADSGIRPALIELSREATSASELYSPCPSSGTNYSYLNAGTISACTGGQRPGGSAILMLTSITTGSTPQPACSQWRVYHGQLEERFWNPASMPSSLGFTNVAPEVILRNNLSQPPFQLHAATGSGSNLLDVSFFLAPLAGRTTAGEVSTSFAAQGVAPVESSSSTSSSTTTSSSSTTTTTTLATGASCGSTPALPSGDS